MEIYDRRERNVLYANDDIATFKELVVLAVRNNIRLDNADFSSMDLSGVDLCGMEARNANFEDTILLGTRLSRSSMRGSKFYGTDLRAANLEYATLAWSCFVNVHTRGAVINADTSLEGSVFSQCDHIINLGTPDNWHAYAFMDEKSWARVKVGCKMLGIDQALTYWSGKSDRKEVVAAVEYAKQIAHIRGWSI